MIRRMSFVSLRPCFVLPGLSVGHWWPMTLVHDCIHLRRMNNGEGDNDRHLGRTRNRKREKFWQPYSRSTAAAIVLPSLYFNMAVLFLPTCIIGNRLDEFLVGGNDLYTVVKSYYRYLSFLSAVSETRCRI